MASLIARHYTRMALQLMDSAVPETRRFWRGKLNFKQWVIDDPRTIDEIVRGLRNGL